MRKLKYVRFNLGFITFAEPIAHNEIKFIESKFNITESPISAGFYYLTVQDGEIIAKCYGESITLNLKSLPEDSELLTRQMNGEWS